MRLAPRCPSRYGRQTGPWSMRADDPFPTKGSFHWIGHRKRGPVSTLPSLRRAASEAFDGETGLQPQQPAQTPKRSLSPSST